MKPRSYKGNIFICLLTHRTQMEIGFERSQNPRRLHWNHPSGKRRRLSLPLGSWRRPGSRPGSSWWGPAGCSSSRCRCGCHPRWRAWPRAGCWGPARLCSSGRRPCRAACCGSWTTGSSPRIPVLSASPGGSRPPPPPPPGRHWEETSNRLLIPGKPGESRN